MELKLDIQQFDKLQKLLVEEILLSIRFKLQLVGMQGEELEDLTTQIAFKMASILDDHAAIEVDGVEVRPYLTFRGTDDELIHCGENAYSNECIYEAVKKHFGKA